MTWWRRAFPLDLAEEGHFSRREFARFLAVVSAGFTTGIGYLWLRKKPLEGASDPEAGTHELPVALGRPRTCNRARAASSPSVMPRTAASSCAHPRAS